MWTNLVEYFQVTPTYVQTLIDGTVITHSFNPVGVQALSHSVGSTYFSIIDNSGTNVYGSTIFANTGYANCPLPGVPIELVRDGGQVMKTTSAPDGTFSFSVALGVAVEGFEVGTAVGTSVGGFPFSLLLHESPLKT